jgi:UDP-glucose 4-epimerase
LTIHGDGRQTRDFVYVADVVEHLLAAMRLLNHAPQAGVLNVCTGRATSVCALAEILGTATSWAPEIVPGPARPGDIRHSVGDPAAAAALLGLRATTRLEDGLEATLASLAQSIPGSRSVR